jgi:hypothetical protein
MVFTKYLNEGIVFLIGLVGLWNTPPSFKIYVMEPKGFVGYPNRGIAHALSSYGHEQYPFDSLNQNNSAHGVYIIPWCGYYFLFRFW